MYHLPMLLKYNSKFEGMILAICLRIMGDGSSNKGGSFEYGSVGIM